MNQNNVVERLIKSMQDEIEKHGLEILQRYPNDVLVHDRAMLEWAAVPGMKLAWMCGHCHTHAVPLGLHREETGMVANLTNLSSEDRFYLIQVRHGGFSINEVTREAFGALANTPSEYLTLDNMRSCWLKRKDMSRVGAIEVISEGNWQNVVYKARITPLAGISPMDKAALNVWCSYAIRKVAGSLFVKSEVTWAEPIRLAA